MLVLFIENLSFTMNIGLTWDLFIIAFFAIIIAYSFIIGRNNTIKIILGTYVGALAADAAGNLFGSYFGNSSMFLSVLHEFSPASNPESSAAMFKVVTFIVIVIILAVRGGFTINTDLGKSTTARIIINGFFGFLSAGLMISVVFMYVSGISFITGSQTGGITSITAQSPVIQHMIKYYNYWFLLPALTLIFGGIIAGHEEK